MDAASQVPLPLDEAAKESLVPQTRAAQPQGHLHHLGKNFLPLTSLKPVVLELGSEGDGAVGGRRGRILSMAGGGRVEQALRARWQLVGGGRG